MTEKDVELFNDQGISALDAEKMVECCGCKKELPKSHSFVFPAIEKKYICQDCYLQLG